MLKFRARKSVHPFFRYVANSPVYHSYTHILSQQYHLL